MRLALWLILAAFVTHFLVWMAWATWRNWHRWGD